MYELKSLDLGSPMRWGPLVEQIREACKEAGHELQKAEYSTHDPKRGIRLHVCKECLYHYHEDFQKWES